MTPRRLVDLHPEFGRIYPWDGTKHWLTFDCVKCGPPFRVYVMFQRENAAHPVWQATSQWALVKDLEHLGEQPNLATLTLVPSVNYQTHGTRKPSCGWHFNVTNGSVA